MFCVSVNQHVSFDLPKEQWLRIIGAARQTWPNEKLSNAELLRRCVILGVRTLRYLSPESARQSFTATISHHSTGIGA